MVQRVQAGGMKTFTIIWIGQVLSSFGSRLTGFSLGVWVYQETGSVTQYSLIWLATLLPGLLLSPVLGVMVDRYDRRWLMILGDVGAALATLGIVALFLTDSLEVWHIYALMGASSVFRSVQWPAFSAATSLLVPKRNLGRASGMSESGRSVAFLLGPLAAGFLLDVIQIWGIILIDIVSFIFAAGTLLIVSIPRPEVTEEGRSSQGTMAQQIRYSLQYLVDRPSLRSLLFIIAGFNFTGAMLRALLTPLILSFSTASVLGVVMFVANIGALAGGLVMSVWGGPKRRVMAVLGVILFQGVLLVLGGLVESAIWIASIAFVFLVVTPIIQGCNQSVWQSKVAPDIQGRVFSIRRLISLSANPIAYVVAGPLADFVFEPLMAGGSTLAGSVGRIIGTGAGRGIALMIILLGLLHSGMALVGLSSRRLKRLEEDLPDAVGEAPAPGEGQAETVADKTDLSDNRPIAAAEEAIESKSATIEKSE